MAPPSSLAIATSVVQRLVKEEASYHKELEKQEARLQQTQASDDGDENKEYQLKQERAAIEETKRVFPPLRQRILEAVQRLEDGLQEEQAKGDVPSDEVAKAEEVIQSAKVATTS
ncbi:MAG: hypothetical protein M1818_005885 [Claussenomyces sp. TS43310]|nr:MAG: hypothetical protein M1818_005885 [Claussenomyces sp. TS43310]